MTPSKAAAAESWLETSDAVLRGLNHEFSNRLSLARLAPQLSAMLGAGEPGLQKLVADSDRSEDMLQLLRLFRLLPFSNGDPPEPVLVSDAVSDAVDLFHHHSSFRDVEVQGNADPSVPPTLINSAALRQAILLLLCVAARQAGLATGEAGAIALGFSATTDSIQIDARVRDADDHGAIADSPELPALRYLTRSAGGAVEIARRGATLSIGTLVRLRRLEKQR